MTTNTRRFLIPFMALLSLALVGLIACTAQDIPAPAQESASATESQAPADAMDAMKPATPQASIDDFVSQHEDISSAWDQLHDDFDEWNAGLDACHPNAMHQALNEFAVSFNDVTQDAQNLSRGKTSGELADLLIVAAQEEETAGVRLDVLWLDGANLRLLGLPVDSRLRVVR